MELKVNLLLDANLSWRLCKTLADHFEIVEHVDRIGIGVPATDLQIWDWAKVHKSVIITNDEDYLDFSTMRGFPPKVVLLRVGNQSNRYLADLLISKKEEIENLISSQHYGLLEIF
ncbi:MAG: DUF5615 family PIN-like protein [Bacteroidota bacterium]